MFWCARNPKEKTSETSPFTFGSGWTCFSTFSFKNFKSTQMRTSPDCFETTIMAVHHGVETSTLEITPIVSSGRGTFLGVYIQSIRFSIWLHFDGVHFFHCS